MRQQVGGLNVIHPDVHIGEGAWEEVVNLHGDVQDVADTMGANT